MAVLSPLQVREAQLAQYNYILVVGEEEKKAGTVNVRTRDNQVRAAGGASRAAGSHRCCCSRWPPACVPQPARRQRC